jgi:hypothetical protein
MRVHVPERRDSVAQVAELRLSRLRHLGVRLPQLDRPPHQIVIHIATATLRVDFRFFWFQQFKLRRSDPIR